jgi:hypothetical protein
MKKRGKRVTIISKKKRKIFMIISVIIVVTVVLILAISLMSIKFKNSGYEAYYEKACKAQAEENNYQDRINSTNSYYYEQSDKIIEEGKFLKLCMNTGGCYFGGNACPPSQETSILEQIRDFGGVCTLVLVGQCACPFGTTFNSEKGCI